MTTRAEPGTATPELATRTMTGTTARRARVLRGAGLLLAVGALLGSMADGCASTAKKTAGDVVNTAATDEFARHASLVIGATREWIDKPYAAGALAAGANDRDTALLKAGLTATYAAEQTQDAILDAQAVPKIHDALDGLSGQADQLSAVAQKLRSGDAVGDEVRVADALAADLARTAARAGVQLSPRTPTLLDIGFDSVM
jgi:hypothetical protein